MASANEDLAVFNKLDTEKIKQIFDMVDESIVRKPLKKQVLDEITHSSLSNTDVLTIHRICLNFAVSDHLDELAKDIANSNIDKDKQDVLKQCLLSLNNRLSKEILETEYRIASLHDFGHSHIGNLQIASEFRPISNDDGKIIKIIPSLVFSGSLHNPESKDRTSLNFHLDLQQAKMLVTDMQDMVARMEREVHTFREKFGDDSVAV